MLIIGKALILLVLELGIEYLFGIMLTMLLLKREVTPFFSLLIGFISYQALFQIVAMPVILTTQVLHHLTFAWGGMVILLTVISGIIGKGIAGRQIKTFVSQAYYHKSLCIAVTLVVAAFCYFLAINGENNEDARYYIALMTTSVDTDSLFRYNVYNGYQVESLYLRRAFATFEVQGAVYSQMFGIHPLIIARIFRACQNGILTSAAVYTCSMVLFYEKEQKAVSKALQTVIAFWGMQIPFSNTIYTPATFLLYRAYEAKAFTANLIVLLGICICAIILRERKARNLWMLVLYLWGSMAISTSAMLVAGVECLLILLPVWIQRGIRKKKQEKMHANESVIS